MMTKLKKLRKRARARALRFRDAIPKKLDGEDNECSIPEASIQPIRVRGGIPQIFM